MEGSDEVATNDNMKLRLRGLAVNEKLSFSLVAAHQTNNAAKGRIRSHHSAGETISNGSPVISSR